SNPPTRTLSQREDYAVARRRLGNRPDQWVKIKCVGGTKRVSQCPLWVKSRHLQCNKRVRFTPESGHVRRDEGCPLTTKSGHRAPSLHQCWNRIQESEQPLIGVRESLLTCAQQLGDTKQDQLVVVLHVRFTTGRVWQIVVVRDYYVVAVHHVHVLDCHER